MNPVKITTTRQGRTAMWKHNGGNAKQRRTLTRTMQNRAEITFNLMLVNDSIQTITPDDLMRSGR